ncbi:FAD-binding protein [Collinsella sp. BA40]|uniref:NAD(P)/FAD-dependent oxidoreductase n=1 Tax=Collinsella sp. BA40 TaxID=2560852 RepID=UPI0011CCC243|nr:FAD-binding protein [Collinsella sp. BA40]TXF34920.1 FAD-binding protein [Collinsella sp. BA40]
MIEVTEIKVALDDGVDEHAFLEAALKDVCSMLQVSQGDILDAQLYRTSVDARKKRDVHFTVTIRFELASSGAEEEAIGRVAEKARRRVRIIEPRTTTFPQPLGARGATTDRPIVVGAGCAGLFAALTLAEAGLEPLLIERGDDAERRGEAVRRFNETGVLDPESNIQFGLGGAGTFSDGKLNTGTKNPDHRLILETLAAAGAPRDILWDAKPHIGSDILPSVVTAIIARIRACGGEVRFRTKLLDIERSDSGAVVGVTVMSDEREERLATRHLILACGHSARDIFEMLQRRNFTLARKTFAMGARIEHLQEAIDRAQYGPAAGHPALGAAPYKLVSHAPNGRSLFTFCMCPGGEVVAAASEEGGVVTNGASLHARAGRNANAALLVNVTPKDLPGDDVLAGIKLQRECEQAAFQLGGGDYRAPAQLVGDFLIGIPSTSGAGVIPTYPRGVTWTAIGLVLPAYVSDTMRLGLPELARHLKGFDDEEAVITGVETRSSAPITVVRDKSCHAEHAPGLYPCGEGAGYAGGIMSAATDGIRCARALIDDLTA